LVEIGSLPQDGAAAPGGLWWLPTHATEWGFYLTVGGFVFTLVGFIIVLVQLRRMKRTTDAAKAAADQALSALASRQSIGDLGTIFGYCRQAQASVRHEHFEAALLQVQSLRTELHQLRMRPGFGENARLSAIQGHVTVLVRIESALESKVHNPNRSIDSVGTNAALAEVADTIASWRAEMDYPTDRLTGRTE
jgi:hypothetical protein